MAAEVKGEAEGGEPTGRQPEGKRSGPREPGGVPPDALSESPAEGRLEQLLGSQRADRHPPWLWPRWPNLGYVMAVGFSLALVWGVSRAIAGQIDVFFVGFLAILMAAILNYPVTFLSRWIPRSVAAVLTIVVALGLLTLIIYLTIPTIADQVSSLGNQIPDSVKKGEQWWTAHVERGGGASPGRRSMVGSLAQSLAERLGTLAVSALPAVYGAVSGLVAVLAIIVLAVFLSIDPGTYVNGIVLLVPRRLEGVVRQFLSRIGVVLSQWMLGTLIAMTVMGICTGLGLLLIFHMDGWLVLGLFAFLGEFVPYVGPLLGSAPAIFIGLAQSPTQAVYVGLFYMALWHLEAYVVQPLAMRRAVHLNPAVLIFWQALFASLFGIAGLLVATPLLATFKVGVEYFYVERTLGKRGGFEKVSSELPPDPEQGRGADSPGRSEHRSPGA